LSFRKIFTEITNKEFYFIIAAAENDKAMMERTIDGFRGFLDCSVLSFRKIFSTSLPASIAPFINSSQSKSELPPLRVFLVCYIDYEI